MQAGCRWKRFQRRLRYWLDHSQRQRLLWEEMEFHIDSMADDLVAQGMAVVGSTRRGAQKVWQHDTKIGTSPLHLDRPLDERSRAGSTPGVSRNAPRCRICRLRDSHRRPRHRGRFHRLQRRERAAAAPAAVSRCRVTGVDLERRPKRRRVGNPGRTNSWTSGSATSRFPIWQDGTGTTGRATGN